VTISEPRSLDELYAELSFLYGQVKGLEWVIARRQYEEGVPILGAVCGGCIGLGRHQKHCRQNPDYNRWAELADRVESLGDEVGSNDMGAANRLYEVAGRLRTKAREERSRGTN
jgi:hypothetical protein